MPREASHDRDFVVKNIRDTLTRLKGNRLTPVLIDLLALVLSRRFPISHGRVVEMLSNPLYAGRVIDDGLVEDRTNNIAALILCYAELGEVA